MESFFLISSGEFGSLAMYRRPVSRLMLSWSGSRSKGLRGGGVALKIKLMIFHTHGKRRALTLIVADCQLQHTPLFIHGHAIADFVV